MVIFQSSANGDQLLVNSSADAVGSFLPEVLRGRANLTNHHLLLGLLIRHLKPSDSGLYRAECWQNEMLVSHPPPQQLVVCSEEVESEKMTVLEDGGAEVWCSGSTGAPVGATVRWYYEVRPSYKAILFLDSSVSLDPLLPVLQGAVEVRPGGALLRVSRSVLQDFQQIYCAVMNGQNCLRFQNINLPKNADVRTIYASQGDRVALKCSSEHKSQRWETPLGKINTTTKSPASRKMYIGQMYILGDNESKSRTLVIPVVSGKHMGDYSCFSPALVVQHRIVLCPWVVPKEKRSVEGGDILLECDVPRHNPFGGDYMVQWHHDRGAGETSLIQNRIDEAVSHPGDPRRGGRNPLTMKKKNKREEEEEEEADYTGDGSYDGYDGYDSYIDSSRIGLDGCISKQGIVLTVALNVSEDKGRGLHPAPKDLANHPQNDPTPAPASGFPGYTLEAMVVVAGLLLLVGPEFLYLCSFTPHFSSTEP
ncbi:unnamed protein product [Merluccius merluccius]